MSNHKRELVDVRVNVPPDIVSRASEGDAAAQLTLGKAYFDATLAEDNHYLAFKWICRSAEQGNMEAQFRLGDLYALGQGTSKHFPDAYKWYTKAAIQGYKKALIRIHNLYQGDIKMQCRGQINSEEDIWVSAWFKRNNKIRELYEYRLKQHRPILNGAIDYYTALFKQYQACNQEDPTVQINLAFLYQRGYGVKKCISWAFEYYTLAAEQGNRDAQYNLGNLYQKHTEITFNYRKAIKWYKESAQGGNIAAQKSLAYFYLKGLATDIDYDVALYWYTKAAEAGDSASQVILGKLYRKGDCVKQDLSVAVKWYSQAARQGNIVAQNCLAQLHQRGMLDSIKLEEDMSEYATEDSMNSRLCTKLSLVVSKLGKSPKFKQLNELARRALIGDGQAMYEIGLKYLNGNHGFTQDLENGVKWIKNAANAKHKDAQLMIADLYKKGDSIEQDYNKATIWYKTRAKKKDAGAQCNLGVMYNEGLGVREDPLEASKWFTWAADQGNSDAQYCLGILRLYGSGIRGDKEEAVKWFLKSAHQRNIQACYEIGMAYLYGLYQTEENAKRGLALLEIAAKNGLTDAQWELGKKYGFKRTEHYDFSKSISYYTMAADSGNCDAQEELARIYQDEHDSGGNYIKMFNLFKQGRDRGYEFFKDLFEIPVDPLYGLDYSKISSMFIEVTKKGLDRLHYNIGLWYENGIEDERRCFFDINYSSAIEWYLTASVNGDSRADYRLGIMHEYGKHFEINMDTAISYYNKASLQGNTDAIYRLGSIYANGNGVTQDLLKAHHLYTKAFSMGNEDAGKELEVERSYNIFHSSFPRSYTADPEISLDRATRISMLEKATEEGFTGLQYQLGVMYEKLNNHQKAFKWLSLAAEIGVTDAYFRLGTFYEEGRGVAQDYAMAAHMYQKATEKGHEDACYKLSRLYQYGNGVVLDYLTAYHFYKKAADMGHVKASKILNLSLDTKLNSNEDTELSSQELQDSLLVCKHVAEHGDADVQFKVGFAYEHSVSEPNYVEAYNWYSMAAKSSHQKALYHLGLLYEKGLGISQCHLKAIQLYEQASQQKNDGALYRLGVAYHYGTGVDVDLKKAVEYYTRAAEQGKPEYQCQLGELYEEGQLVEKNLLEALKWYTKAYLQGYDTIRSRLSTMYEHEPYEDFFFERLLRNLTIASIGYFRLNDHYYYNDYGEINSRLGALYFFGHGTDKDISKAWKYFSRKYSFDEDKEFFFLVSGALSSDEKNDILNALEQDEIAIRQMNVRQLYALGMDFFYGVRKGQDGYTTFENRNQDNSSQDIVIEKNYTKAFKYLKRAADDDDPDALLQLGIMHHCGYGSEKNMEQGEKYFDSLAKTHLKDVGRIAMLYHTHCEMQNFDKALEWYTRFEERLDEGLSIRNKPDFRAQIHFGMGLLYEFGDGVKQSYQKAFEYYKKVADVHVRAGQHRLGLMYYYGKGVPVDYKEAFDSFKKFRSGRFMGIKLPYVHYQIGWDTNETQNNLVYRMINDTDIPGESYYYLGLMHKHGQGVVQNEEKARVYFEEALDQRCKRAKYEL